jgi:transcription initiation factor TFIIIB Brf1 subunit/transcription initiation factor TFIIB
MAKPIIITPEEFEQAGTLVQNKDSIIEYRRGLIARLLADHKHTAKEVATIFYITEQTVFNELSKIREPR